MASIDKRGIHIDTRRHVDEPPPLIREARQHARPSGRTAGGPFALEFKEQTLLDRPLRKRKRPVLFVVSPFPVLLTEITMYKETSTGALHSRTIPTIYPTRRPTGSRVEDGIHDRYATGQAMPLARTRIFHPFEYWVQEKAGIQYGLDTPSTGSCPDRASRDGRFTRLVIALGWLHAWATRLFHLVRGP